MGVLIGLGGGFQSVTGYLYALYFLIAMAVLSAVRIALFTRETVGRYRERDRALVSRARTHVSAGIPPE